MDRLINSNFNKLYNPNGTQNALNDIKRLLISRNTEAQNKACGYLIEVINRNHLSSRDRSRMIEYLLENDLTVFLCEATSNLDFSLFRSILSCLRMLWRESRFFEEDHASHTMSALLRALAHYAGSGSSTAVDLCLNFLCDLLNGISANKATPVLSVQSAYSTEQLLACLGALAPALKTNPASVISSALVLHSLVSYQPENLTLRGCTAISLAEVLQIWFSLLTDILNHSILIGNNDMSGMCYVVVCQLGINVLRLMKILCGEQKQKDFVQTILADDNESAMMRDSSKQMETCVKQILSELVMFTKDNQTQIGTEEYGVFLKFLLVFFEKNSARGDLSDFCDMLFSKNYLTILPHAQIARNDPAVRKMSTIILGELLKVLTKKYLCVDKIGAENDTFARDIQLGLVELQQGIQVPNVGVQLQNGRPYGLLIYIYFFCQSSENPEEAMAPLLPHLVEHVLSLPKAFKPPPHIIKALWLVFAMSSISNGSLESLAERVYLEKAVEKVISMLHPNPSAYYTHNPAILLWAFTSQRIPNYVKIHVLAQWLQREDSLPCDLATDHTVWELLLNILTQNKHKLALANCKEALYQCLEEGTEEERQEFAVTVWEMLPNVLSKTLIDYNCEIDSNICYLLELATTLLPTEIDQMVCLKSAVLITTIFSKNLSQTGEKPVSKIYFEYVCLKLSLYLLVLAKNQNDNRVLLTYTNRAEFLTLVVAATASADDRVACMAMQLLSYVVHYFTTNKYQPKIVLQMDTRSIIKSFRTAGTGERGACLMQLVYTILSASSNIPLVLSLSLEVASTAQHYSALRALMFRIQLTLCCRESDAQSSASWRTLSSIFKHAIVSQFDTKLVATLTSQPWTHILIQFQLSQNYTHEFLTFTQNWLTLLKITIKKNQEERKMQLSKHSLITKTLLSLKKNLVTEGEEDNDEVKLKIQSIVTDILNDFGAN